MMSPKSFSCVVQEIQHLGYGIKELCLCKVGRRWPSEICSQRSPMHCSRLYHCPTPPRHFPLGLAITVSISCSLHPVFPALVPPLFVQQFCRSCNLACWGFFWIELNSYRSGVGVCGGGDKSQVFASI